MTSSKHDYANYDRFAQNFDMACKITHRVSVPNLKLFGSMKTELWASKLETCLLSPALAGTRRACRACRACEKSHPRVYTQDMFL